MDMSNIPAVSSIPTGEPHEALFLVLAYLPPLELQAMSAVCRSLRDAVNNDVFPWLQITVSRPLSSRLSDDILMKICTKAHGHLATLALINCSNITDRGLHRVVEKNPHISKLYIPGCTSLTPDGVTRAVKTLTEHSYNLTRLQINGIYNIEKHHLQALGSCILQTHPNLNQQPKRPQLLLYHEHKNSSIFKHEVDRPIDLDICPRCDEVRMVFDCPIENCERKRQWGFAPCRGCHLCIPRCVECGACIEPDEQEEAACADTLCTACWLRLAKCNFCNKPYCNQHTDLQHGFPSSSEFVCDLCHAKFVMTPTDCPTGFAQVL